MEWTILEFIKGDKGKVNFMKLLFQFHIYVYVNVCILDCDMNCISHCGLRSKYFENYFFRERSVSKTYPQRLTSQ